MIKTYLVSAKDKAALETMRCPGCDENVLITERYGALVGSFKSANRAAAGTSTIAEPTGGGDGAIILTDLIWATDKVNGATITIQFNDDTNQVVIFAADVTDAPTTGSIAFQGHWQGWQGARLELVTVGNVDATVSCGYYKINKGNADTYAEWDAKR